jgi:putative endonuclease
MALSEEKSLDAQKTVNHEKIDLGMKGEDLAEQYLTEQGYTILKRNQRVGRSDIDILARQDETLVFVEVRTKSKSDRGMPEETLNSPKLQRMRKTAEIYIAIHKYDGPARLDGICIILEGRENIVHFEHYKGIG